MRWFKRAMWKAGIAVAGMLLLLVLMVWVPVSAAGAYEGASGLATPVTGTVQATPTVDPTMTALEKEKLAQEIDQLKNQNYWSWTTIGPILVGFAGLLAAQYSFFTWIRNRQDEQNKRVEEQSRWLDDRQAEREKRAEERFQAVVEGLGSEREEAKIGAAILLRTFLRPGYEQFYIQTFDLAVANLRFPERSVPLDRDPDNSLPLTTLRQVLIVVFKEAFSLARSQYKEGPYQSLDTTGIQLDNAYLVDADLKKVWMPQAFLRKANLSRANLSEANLSEANLSKAYLIGTNLSKTRLRGADLSEADLCNVNLIEAKLSGANFSKANFSRTNLRRDTLRTRELMRLLSGTNRTFALYEMSGEANLSEADLSGVDFSEANLSEADLSEADLSESSIEDALSLKDTDLRGVKGLTEEQLKACKAKGAIIDEAPTISPPQSPVSPSMPEPRNDVQAPSAPSAQVNTPIPDPDRSSAPSSQQGPEA